MKKEILCECAYCKKINIAEFEIDGISSKEM